MPIIKKELQVDKNAIVEAQAYYSSAITPKFHTGRTFFFHELTESKSWKSRKCNRQWQVHRKNRGHITTRREEYVKAQQQAELPTTY